MEEESIDLEDEGSIIEFSLPDFKKAPLDKFYNYVKNVYDYETLPELAAAINAARLALFKVNDALNEVERRGKRAKIEYKRFWIRKYEESAGRTEGEKRAYADILSEDLEDKYLVYEQLLKELSRHSNILRNELDVLKTVSNNTRQQLKMGDE